MYSVQVQGTVQKDCTVLRTDTASAQISHSDRSMQGGSSFFLGLSDLPCQGAYITCWISYQLAWCAIGHAERGWLQVMYPILLSLYTLLRRHLHSYSAIMSTTSTVYVEESPCEG